MLCLAFTYLIIPTIHERVYFKKKIKESNFLTNKISIRLMMKYIFIV
jgi:hypothetical protein